MKKLAVAVLAVLLLVIPIAGVSADAHIVEVERLDLVGGWSCADGQKIEDPETGSYDIIFGRTLGTINITVYPDNTFDFTTDSNSHLVDSVLVKGGPNALLYSFEPGVTSGEGLHAPENTKNPNNGYYGLSHLCFMTDKK